LFVFVGFDEPFSMLASTSQPEDKKMAGDETNSHSIHLLMKPYLLTI
jgi:hypothetical protein